MFTKTFTIERHIEELRAELRVMTDAEGKILLHRAANFRVTAFYSLYALKRLGWSDAEADAFRASVWRGSDYPVWEAFVEQMKSDIQGDRAAPPQ